MEIQRIPNWSPVLPLSKVLQMSGRKKVHREENNPTAAQPEEDAENLQFEDPWEDEFDEEGDGVIEVALPC